MTFWNELKRRKVVRVTIAYLIVGWLLIQVADVTLEPLHLPEWSSTLVIWLIALGFPIAIVLAWMLDVTPEGIKVTADESAKAPVDDASIAVMPFVNMSGDSDNEYFSDGMSEELLNLLARLRDLRVCSRTSSFALKGSSLDMSSIAGKLGVRYVLEGSVRRAGNRVRITAQLIDASSDAHLWSEAYDREIEDIFAVQDEIAGHIFTELKLTLTADEEVAIQSTTDSVDAFDHYLRGREQYHRTDSGHMDRAKQEFEKAIEIDPDYALAWAGLTYVFVDTYWYADKEPIYIDKAHETSRKAVELAPHLAESHAARGLSYRVAEQFDRAEAEFEKAVELNPRLFEPIHFYAQMARSQGQFEKAAELFRKAGAVRPEDYQAVALAGNMYETLGDTANEERLATETVERARRAIDVNPKDARALILGAGSLGRLGEKKEAFEWAERAISIDPESASTAYNIACLLSRYGEHERAIDNLENAVRFGSRNKLYYETDVDFDPLRDHPRFQRLLDSI
jgi:adenylate cyclase